METNTVQTLIDQVKFITGQDNLSNADAIRLLNFAVDEYSYLSLTSDGRWKFDSYNQSKFPIATATLNANEEKIPLNTEYLSLNEVSLLVDGKYRTLQPIDTKDYQDRPVDTVYATAGEPKYYDYDAHYLFPYPQSDTQRTIRIRFSRAHPRYTTDNLTQDTGVIPIHEEFLTLHAAHRLSLRTNDSNRVELRNELQMMTENVRDFFSKRDEDTPRRLKAIVPSAFMGRARKGRRRR